ncbi:hypothetical protein WMY93_031824 [Mugilogobius chulae]|uniref:Uncharacterized protein n=1 Tax=Mugilogobius chulae TaxID=88201 RepID=A0AAW0MF89_9GOBI
METAAAGSERLPGSERPPAGSELQPPPAVSPGDTQGSTPGTRTLRTPRTRGQQRHKARTDPGASSTRAGRRGSSSSRGGAFLCPQLYKTPDCVRLSSLEQREEPRRRSDNRVVLSDSENEEPITRRIRHISAFIRKTTTALSRYESGYSPGLDLV